MKYRGILKTTETHYSGKIKKFGPTFEGVDWGHEKGQKIRFEQLLKPIDVRKIATIIDYGCGYGALLDYLDQKGFSGEYTGYDISAEMIRKAEELYKVRRDQISFTANQKNLKKAEYTLASGIFNVKLETDNKEWCDYVLYTLDQIAKLSRLGFVFNALSSHTPNEFREDDLFYANPDFIFSYCTQRYNSFVTIWNDYPLPDFTVSVRLINSDN